MSKAKLKIEIENLAKEMNIGFIEACSAMQSAAAKKGNEEIIGVIGELKLEFLGL